MKESLTQCPENYFVPFVRDVVVGSLWTEAPFGEVCWNVEQYWKYFPGPDYYCQERLLAPDHKLGRDDQYYDGLLRPVLLHWVYLYSRDFAFYYQPDFMIDSSNYFTSPELCQMIQTIYPSLELKRHNDGTDVSRAKTDDDHSQVQRFRSQDSQM